MTLKIISGFLQPKVVDPDEPKPNLVWGADADGRYLGVVPANDPRVVSVVSRPPPAMLAAKCRWVNSAWTYAPNRDEIVDGIEREREQVIDKGIVWNNIRWYSDPPFQQQLHGFLLLWNEGILGLTDTVQVRGMDKQVRDLNRTQVRELAKAVSQRIQNSYKAQWLRKAQAGV